MNSLLSIFLFLGLCFTRVEATKSTTFLPAKVGTEIEEFAKGKALIAKNVTNEVNDLIKAGNFWDKGGFTAVGRALQKHGSRTGSIFPKAIGNTSCKIW